jgi:hypothetical protein
MAESNSTRHPLITTGSFASAGKNAAAVGISCGIPPGFKGRRYTSLAPTRSMLQIRDVEEFAAAYRKEILDRLDPAKVAHDLGETVMLCWEPFNFCCHRRMVAEWLEEALGISVPEIGHERNESPPWRELPLKPPSRSRSKRPSTTGAQPRPLTVDDWIEFAETLVAKIVEVRQTKPWKFPLAVHITTVAGDPVIDGRYDREGDGRLHFRRDEAAAWIAPEMTMTSAIVIALTGAGGDTFETTVTPRYPELI